MEWISVKDRLPEENKYKTMIVAWKDDDAIGVCGDVCFFNGKFITHDHHYSEIDDFDGVTHWMPLPTPPSE